MGAGAADITQRVNFTRSPCSEPPARKQGVKMASAPRSPVRMRGLPSRPDETKILLSPMRPVRARCLIASG
jgi:hypothetical protein